MNDEDDDMRKAVLNATVKRLRKTVGPMRWSSAHASSVKFALQTPTTANYRNARGTLSELTYSNSLTQSRLEWTSCHIQALTTNTLVLCSQSEIKSSVKLFYLWIYHLYLPTMILNVGYSRGAAYF
jgi:hypothetical protein